VVLARGPQAGARTQARPGPGGKSDDSFFNSFIKGDLPQRIGTVLVRPPGGCGCARRDRPAPTASCSRARTRESLRGERDQGGLCCPRVAPYIRSSQAGSGALAACWRRWHRLAARQVLVIFSRIGIYVRLPGVDVSRFADSMQARRSRPPALSSVS